MRSDGRDAGQDQLDGLSCLDDQMTRRVGVAVQNDGGSLNAIQLIDRYL